MSQAPGSFRPSELDGADQRLGDADLAGAWSVARELESALPGETIAPSAGFADRVMAAVALEPVPRSTGFLAVLRTRPGLAGLAASVREAWTVVAQGPGRPVRARAFALAYVLAVVVIGTSFAGVAAYGAAGALGLLEADASPTPTVRETVEPSTAPTRSLMPSPTVAPSPTPTGSVEPSESAEPDGSSEPEESDDHGGGSPGASSGASPEASDDSESSPQPSPDDESSGGPTDSPRPSDTPKPSQTPD